LGVLSNQRDESPWNCRFSAIAVKEEIDVDLTGLQWPEMFINLARGIHCHLHIDVVPRAGHIRDQATPAEFFDPPDDAQAVVLTHGPIVTRVSTSASGSAVRSTVRPPSGYASPVVRHCVGQKLESEVIV